MDPKYFCESQYAEIDISSRKCCEDELIMNDKEHEMLQQNNDSLLTHQLFTNISLENIPELESEVEQTEIEYLK